MMPDKESRLKETLWCVGTLAVWLVVTGLFIGFRPEHAFMAVLILALFFASGFTRRVIVALVPFFLFGISYDWMNLLPNYEVNPIDTSDLYNLEKDWWGIATAAGTLTPNEFFAIHNCKFMDFMAGVFYLCWVPVPIFFGLWMYFRGLSKPYLHFALVFLLVNLIGFALYYVHPAAPPWYISLHGFAPVVGTMGNVAGLGAFDEMTGLGIFNGLYARNANVFAAMPSLHSAYTFVAFIYAMRTRQIGWGWRAALAVITLGIWFTAVYTSHHYIFDVLGGIACSLVGFCLFEFGFMRFGGFRSFIDKYASYITKPKIN